MFIKKKSGFTLMELLVVMSIIVILAALSLPAMLKARKSTALKKAEIDMATIASALSQVAQDTGYYCNLGALTQATTPAFFDNGVDGLPGTADYTNKDGWSTGNAGEGSLTYCGVNGNVPEPKPYIDSSADNLYQGTETTYWKGPYVTYNASKLFKVTSPTNGILPEIPSSPAVIADRFEYAGVAGGTFPGGWNYVPWDTTNTVANKDFICKQIPSAPSALPADAVSGAYTPLDPWGHPYTISYSDPCVRYAGTIWGEGVMVIYSAGPDGKLTTPRGSPTPRDAFGRYRGTDADYNGDDMIYKFK